MSLYHREFCLEVLTPDGPVCTADTVSLVFPAADGEIGILGGRAPLIAMLSAGRLTFEDTAGKDHAYFISGGFAHVRDNGVTIVAEQCISADQLDLEQAKDELAKAQAIPSMPETRERRTLAIQSARAKVKLAQQAKKSQ